MTAPARYLPVMFLRTDDDRRRWLVVDLRPWESKAGTKPGKAGTVVADVMGEAMATRIADALNGQPTVDDDAEPAAGVSVVVSAAVPPGEVRLVAPDPLYPPPTHVAADEEPF